MPPEFDPTLNDKVSNVAKALEDAVLGLLHRQPLDTSGVNAAIEKFDSRQDQANALCSAVMQVNPKQTASDIHVPPLFINYEKGGSDWAALHVSTNIISNDNASNVETLYVLPITQDELKNVKCDLIKPAHQADATSAGATALNPDHK